MVPISVLSESSPGKSDVLKPHGSRYKSTQALNFELRGCLVLSLFCFFVSVLETCFLKRIFLEQKEKKHLLFVLKNQIFFEHIFRNSLLTQPNQT